MQARVDATVESESLGTSNILAKADSAGTTPRCADDRTDDRTGDRTDDRTGDRTEPSFTVNQSQSDVGQEQVTLTQY